MSAIILTERGLLSEEEEDGRDGQQQSGPSNERVTQNQRAGVMRVGRSVYSILPFPNGRTEQNCRSWVGQRGKEGDSYGCVVLAPNPGKRRFE